MPAKTSPVPQKRKTHRLAGWLRLGLAFLMAFFLLRWLVEFLRRWLRPPAPAPEIELPPAPPEIEIPAPPPVTEALPEVEVEGGFEEAAPPVVEEAPPEIFGLPMEEVEVSFEAPVVEVIPAIPDIFSTIPPEILLESDEPFTAPDGSLVRPQFNWQNPQLLKRIYPFRAEKLLDFLLYYAEIDLVQDFKARGAADPDIQARLEQSKAEIKQRRVEVIQQLEAAIAARQASDPWFAAIKFTSQKNFRFKQTYYLDRLIQKARDQLDDLLDQQEVYLKRVDWWPDDPSKPDKLREHARLQRERWQSKAQEQDAPIRQTRQEIERLSTFRSLFDQEAELPGEEVSVQDVLRWEIRQEKERWAPLLKEYEDDPLKVQAQLLEAIINRINRQPDRFPEWLVYMVVHFSGMRYTSAHSSWADPRSLLETLRREDLVAEAKRLTGEQLVQACRAAAARLKQRLAQLPERKKLFEALVDGLEPPDSRALQNALTAENEEDVRALKDDDACLNALSAFREQLAERARQDPSRAPMPEWVWAEICKFTPLRLQTSDPNWESSSPERWKYQNNRWREVLATWQQKDITAWRKKHRDSLDLVVIRAVCNEIAEHIQHLRGNAVWAGLTSKPKWFLSEQAKDPRRAYFVQSPAEQHFKTGASILWLEWVETQPNPWQIARPLTGFSLSPSDGKTAKPGEKKGEVSKKQLEKLKAENGDWDYQSPDNAYIRQRRLPSRQELRKQGKTEQEINALLAERKVTGEFETQYLRWRHEATVVGVFDLIDGRYVMTFETGQIGLRLRSLRELAGNPLIFVGYVPEKPLPPDPVDPAKTLDARLVQMLRWDRVLPGSALPPRPRPKKIVDELPTTPGGEPDEPPPPPEPLRPVVVIRPDLRAFRFKQLDQLGRPKMEPVTPLVRLPIGVLLQVSKTRKISLSDRGDGLINSEKGAFLAVGECVEVPLAAGTYISKAAVADASGGRWVTLIPGLEKALCNVYKGNDLKGKPIIQPLENIAQRVILTPGVKLRISTSHRDSDKDSGDGTILGTGLAAFYLILECPDLPEAAGLYVEKAAVFPTAPPVA